METTRHYTATAYVVNDGATALHDHRRLGLVLPPGGHIERDELPHEAAMREVREEMGLEPTLVGNHDPDVSSPTARPIPRPRRLMLEDIDVYPDGTVGHQHVDHIFYATVENRDISPAVTEEDTDAWAWYSADALRTADLDQDVVQLGLEAIEAVDTHVR